MATKYAVATGNWSATTTWNGSTLPTSADDVYSNTFTVTIDQDITVLSLRNSSTTGVTAGGGFACSTARNITCTGVGIQLGTAANLLTLTHTTGNTVTITSAINGNGSIQNGSSVYINGTGTVNIIGNITGAGQSGGSTGAVVVNAAATVNITGNISATSGQNGVSFFSSGVLNVTGSISSSSVNSAWGVYMSGSGALTVTSSSITATGTNPAVSAAGGGTATFIGSLTGSNPIAVNSSTTTTTFSGPFYCSATGYMPFYCTGIVKLTGIANNEFRFLKSTTGTTSLFSGDVTSLSPLPSDVRAGTTFGVGNAYTGTMSVPSASSVAAGAYVDDTVGTAALSLSTIAALTGAQISAALST